MENSNLILTSGAGIGSSIVMQGAVAPELDMSQLANALTHPTTGPLFGSFKLEHHVYTGPVRLYNSWLHNNRTKIGLNMEQVKLPQIKVKIRTLSDTPSNDEEQWIQVNPSCLLAYLGIRGYANTPKSGEKTVSKNARTYRDWETDRKSTRLNSSHRSLSRMPSSA